MKKWFDSTWYKIIENKAKKEATIYLYGTIGSWDISASSFVTEMNALDDSVETLHVRINSPGGDVFDGIAIYNTLKSSGKKVITYNDSIAASIASVIYMAGDKKVIYNTSEIMVHNPWTVSIGNADQLRRDADLLDRIKANIRKAYKTGVKELSDAELDDMMDKETWMNAEESVAFGFADEIGNEEDAPKEEDTKDVWTNEIFAKFQNLPMRVAALVTHKPKPKNQTIKKEDSDMNPDQIKALVKETIEAVLANRPAPAVPAEATPDQKDAIEKAVKAAVEGERVRAQSIRVSGERLNMKKEVIDQAIAEGKTVAEANEIFIAAHAESLKGVPANSVNVGVEDSEKFRAGTVKSFCDVLGLPISKEDRDSVRAQDLPRSMHGLVRAQLRREGRLSANRIDNMTAADLGREGVRLIKNMGTGDLTNILADTINKALGAGFEAAPTTWEPWVKVVSVADFKTFKLPKISGFSEIKDLPEGAAFDRGVFSDKYESGAITVKGRSLNVSWQTIVNDDLGALGRIPSAMGSSYNWRINKDVYDQLYGAAGVGATMLEDSTACFTTGHGNFLAQGSGGAPSITTLGTARKAMRNQTGPKAQNDDTSRRLNLVPAFLICGTTLETTVEQLLMSKADISKSNDITYNPFTAGARTPLVPIIDAYLDSKTTTGWYLATNQNMMETIVLLALEGRVAPYIRSEDSRVGESLGVNWDIYGAFAAMTADYRGLYYNYGA